MSQSGYPICGGCGKVLSTDRFIVSIVAGPGRTHMECTCRVISTFVRGKRISAARYVCGKCSVPIAPAVLTRVFGKGSQVKSEEVLLPCACGWSTPVKRGHSFPPVRSFAR